MNAKACPDKTCHPVIGPEDVYCHKCGKALVPRPTCECGKPYLVGVDRFCPKCGRKLAVLDTATVSA